MLVEVGSGHAGLGDKPIALSPNLVTTPPTEEHDERGSPQAAGRSAHNTTHSQVWSLLSAAVQSVERHHSRYPNHALTRSLSRSSKPASRTPLTSLAPTPAIPLKFGRSRIVMSRRGASESPAC